MLQKPFLWIFLLLFSLSSSAQSDLQVQGMSPNLSLLHKVQAKETWYSIGRLYNLSPKDIASFNKTELSIGLSIGQPLKVPLLPANFSQNGNKSAEEVLVPLYHKVVEGEWMYRVSTNYNKVPIEQLEKWNNISRNQVKAGLNLVVGYLKVKKDQSALAGQSQTELSVIPKTSAELPKEVKPVTTTTVNTDNKQPVSKPENAPELKKEELPASNTSSTTSTAPIDFKGGYFKSQFESAGKSSRGVTNIFRSTSGWNDGKYYVLMDNIPVGTIVMVTNPSNNKGVYAKVLGNLSDIKENAGLTARISNAAAAELGTGESKFTAEIRY
jgi:LysM repeat protein